MVNLENYEEYLLMEADGELKEAERKALYAFLAEHPEFKKELDLYKAAHLMPETDILYTGKEKLLKQPGKAGIFTLKNSWKYMAAAAVLTFLFISIYNRRDDTTKTTVTDSKSTISDASKLNDTPAPVVKAKEEELHSLPANPIAYKEKKQTKVPVLSRYKGGSYKGYSEPVNKTEQVAEVKKQHQPTTPLPIAAPELPVKTEMQPDIELVAEEIAIPKPDSILSDSKAANKMLSWSRLEEERLLGINDLTNAVSNKLEQVRNLKNKIKESEIAFKIGKKEIFVVTL